MFILIRFTIFIWKVCFKKTRHVYNVVVRSIIIYDNNIWHAFHERSNTTITLISKFIDLQKQKLKMMNDVFRVTLNQFLNVETQIQLIELHLTYLQIKTRMRLQEKSHDTLIIDHCNKIKRKLTQSENRWRWFANFTSNERKRFWFKNLCAKINKTTFNEYTSIDKEFKNDYKRNEKTSEMSIKQAKNVEFAWRCRLEFSKNV